MQHPRDVDRHAPRNAHLTQDHEGADEQRHHSRKRLIPVTEPAIPYRRGAARAARHVKAATSAENGVSPHPTVTGKRTAPADTQTATRARRGRRQGPQRWEGV